MSLNPCTVSCGGCERLREEVAALRIDLERLKGRVPAAGGVALPAWLLADEPKDRGEARLP